MTKLLFIPVVNIMERFVFGIEENGSENFEKWCTSSEIIPANLFTEPERRLHRWNTAHDNDGDGSGGRHRLSWKNCEFSHDSRSSSIERQFAFISGLLVKWQGNKRRDFSMAHRCDTLALDSPIALDVGYPYPAVNESCSPRLPVQCTLCSSSSRDSKQQTVLLPARPRSLLARLLALR